VNFLFIFHILNCIYWMSWKYSGLCLLTPGLYSMQPITVPFAKQCSLQLLLFTTR